MPRVFLGLGSNMGDKQAHLDAAVLRLSEHEAIQCLKASSYYCSAPVGYLEQDEFINCVVEIETDLPPLALLALCQHIETALQRKRLRRWGPRTMDVDILLYDDLHQPDEVLTLPHPRMHERAFVLVPLMELDPLLVIGGVKIKRLVENTREQGVNLIYN